MSIEWLAGGGALISTVSNIPQVWKVRNPNTTGDLHLYSTIMHFVAATMWSTYGFYLNLYILAIESAIVGVFNICILLAMYRDR
jgi:MtN3 and saliva related transmembrane protein